ncbi:MAG: superoxide dismutase [Chlorobi bacterium]|nr:superoxide dismutase [Chlorobiota bacterium]
MKLLKNVSSSLIAVMAALFLFSFSQKAYSHCEIPCGIYEDSIRIALLHEDISTIEKSMLKIEALSKEETVNYNQLVRWVNNKDEHAQKIQDIVSQYFLHQRIRIVEPDDENYQKYITQLTLLHKIAVYAMKAKQTTDMEYIDKLRETVALFEEAYFHTHEHK